MLMIDFILSFWLSLLIMGLSCLLNENFYCYNCRLLVIRLNVVAEEYRVHYKLNYFLLSLESGLNSRLLVFALYDLLSIFDLKVSGTAFYGLKWSFVSSHYLFYDRETQRIVLWHLKALVYYEILKGTGFFYCPYGVNTMFKHELVGLTYHLSKLKRISVFFTFLACWSSFSD